MEHTFITDFTIDKQEFSFLTDFVKQQTDSPYLQKVRNKVFKDSVKEQPKSTGFANPFKKIEEENKDNEQVDFNTVSEEKLNEELNEMTEEDYTEVGGLAIEVIDWLLDKVFVMMKRTPSESSKLIDAKKKNVQVMLGRVMQKHNVKFNIETMLAIMFVSYVNAKWSTTKKIEDEETPKEEPKVNKKSKIIKMPNLDDKLNSIAKNEGKEEIKTTTKKVANKGGLIQMAN